jgi:hypothetical protein
MFGVRQSLLTCLPLAQAGLSAVFLAGAGAEAKTSALQMSGSLFVNIT